MKNVIDSADYLAAIQPPVFRHEGKEYQGRLLSVHEYMALMHQVNAVQTADDAQAAYRAIADAIFGRGKKKGESVADILLELPVGAQRGIVHDFLRSQASEAPASPGGGSTSTT